jgi:lipopolysaccharide export system permease protein
LLGRMHQQYSHSFICLVFMFIGAPLGSIIRKGGYGYPLLVSILFYMVFMISFIMGTKLLKSGMLSGFVASWFPVFLLLPFAVYFTTKALNDSRFEAISIITSWVKKRFSREYTPKVIR